MPGQVLILMETRGSIPLSVGNYGWTWMGAAEMLGGGMVEIDTKKSYSAREAADLLGVTPDTVKAYCRTGELNGKQVGPKKQWMISGSEVKRKRKEWNLD